MGAATCGRRLATMPVVDHPDVPSPPPTATLWRYLGLPKFLDLLHRRSLWLSRADLLGDPFEGRYSDAAVRAAKQVWLNDELDPDQLFVHPDGRGYSPTALRRMGEGLSRLMYVNCWHSSDVESAALWSQYAHGQGIALVSSMQNITCAVADSRHFYVGTVQYIDFDKQDWELGSGMTNLLRKRLSFQHEREVRLLYLNPPLTDDLLEQPPGIHVPVDPNQLVDRVVVAPTAPSWYAEVVEAVAEKFNLACEVTRSRLADVPS